MKLQVASRRIWVLGLLGSIPLLIKLPYMFTAWMSSPNDRFDWVFPILSLCAFAATVLTAERAWNKPGITPAAATIMFLLAFIGFQVFSINALAIICAIGFWWSFLWTLRGWRQALELLPAFTILLLGTTSSTYWICVYTGTSYMASFVIKLVITLICLVLSVVNVYVRFYVSQRSSVFGLVWIVCLFFLFQLRNVAQFYQPLLLGDLPDNDEYIVYEMPQSQSSSRFFQTSEAHQYHIANNEYVYKLLSVKCGENIHEIHPASHCLRSGGWQILEERYREITLDDHEFGVTEIEAAFGGRRLLGWVWYSNAYESTGNFLCFRRNWKQGEAWETYQLIVDHYGNISNSRQALFNMLELMRKGGQAGRRR